MHKKKLEKIDIEDDLLIKLTELPHNAFELYVDENGAERLRIKESYQNEFLKMIRSKSRNAVPYLVKIFHLRPNRARYVA